MSGVNGERYIQDLDRAVNVLYTDEAGVRGWRTLIPTGIAFGRGSWWLEATTGREYVRVRMTTIEGVNKIPT